MLISALEEMSIAGLERYTIRQLEQENNFDAPVRRVSGKVEITFTDAALDTDKVTASSTFHETATAASQAFDGVGKTKYKWFTFADNILDGTYCLLPADGSEQVGWWSGIGSGADCVFTEQPSIIAEFPSREIGGLKVIGDEMLNEFPVNFEISVHYANEAENTFHIIKNVVDNAALIWSDAVETLQNVNKLKLTISKWNKPNRLAKIVEFYSPMIVTYESKDLIKMDVLEERELSNGSLPLGNISSNQLDLEINNIDKRFLEGGLANLLLPYRKIRAWLGAGGEWVKMGTFYSIDWDVPDNQISASVTARDRMETLKRNDFRSEVYTNKSLYDLAVIVATGAGLALTEYTIDVSLKNTVLAYSYFDTDSYREALRIIAEAALATAYCDRNDIIVIEKFAIDTSTSIYQLSNEKNIMPGRSTKTNWSSVANSVTVEVSEIILDEDNADPELYKDPDDKPQKILAGETKTFTVSHSAAIASNVEIFDVNGETAPNLAIVSRRFFAKETDVTIKAIADMEFYIVVTGTPLKNTESQKIKLEDTKSVKSNGRLSYSFKNPFVQTIERGIEIAKGILAIFKDPRKDIELNTRGNPALVLGDRVTVPAANNAKQDYFITRQNFSFDGGLSCQVSGRKAIE